jgi:hypothetical protein
VTQDPQALTINKTLNIQQTNGKPQVIGEENSPGEEKTAPQQVLCKDHAQRRPQAARHHQQGRGSSPLPEGSEDAGQAGQDQHHPQEQGSQLEVGSLQAHQQAGIKHSPKHTSDRYQEVAVVFCSFLADKLRLSDHLFVPLHKISKNEK